MVASVKERRTRILITLFLLNREQAHNLFTDKIKVGFSLPTKSPRSRGTLRQMLADKIILKEAESNYQITEAGIKELALSFPFVRFQVFSWDEKFRILTYEIPEKKRKLRDSLRRSISSWGLGPWHRSFWLTAHPIIDSLKNLIAGTAWQEYVQAFEAIPVVGDQAILLEKVWNLKKIESEYRQLFKRWHEVLSNENIPKQKKMQKIVNEYLNVLKQDPGLPEKLMTKQWIGKEAWDIFQEMRNILIANN